MSGKIKADVLQSLDDWKAGRPVKSLELGHTHRMAHSEEYMQSNPAARNRVDMSKRIANDQERAYAYLFYIIDFYTGNVPVPDVHDDYLAACEALRKDFDVTSEEVVAAESLAWKALHCGWARAIAGHDAHMYIEVSNPAVSAT
jgi:hypothetical protein